MTSVENKLIEACLHYENNPETVKSICGFTWIVDVIKKLHIDR